MNNNKWFIILGGLGAVLKELDKKGTSWKKVLLSAILGGVIAFGLSGLMLLLLSTVINFELGENIIFLIAFTLGNVSSNILGFFQKYSDKWMNEQINDKDKK